MDDNLWPFENEITTDPRRIQALLDEGQISYLALTEIEGEQNWDRFRIWATAHLRNYRDWSRFIDPATTIRGSDPNAAQARWSYRRCTIEDVWYGFRLDEFWKPDDQLTTILQSAARSVAENTQAELAKPAMAPGRLFGPQPPMLLADVYHSTEVFATKPRATGRTRFRRGVTEPTLYTVHRQDRRTGYAASATFYVFPDAAVAEYGEVPKGFVVVGGADYATYVDIHRTQNVIRVPAIGVFAQSLPGQRFPNDLELLLARAADLEDLEGPRQ